MFCLCCVSCFFFPIFGDGQHPFTLKAIFTSSSSLRPFRIVSLLRFLFSLSVYLCAFSPECFVCPVVLPDVITVSPQPTISFLPPGFVLPHNVFLFFYRDPLTNLVDGGWTPFCLSSPYFFSPVAGFFMALIWSLLPVQLTLTPLLPPNSCLLVASICPLPL